MDSQLLLVAIGVLTSCLNLLLAAFLTLARGPNWGANRFLAGFLALSAVDMAGWAGDLLPASAEPLLILRRSLAFMQMPLFFAYFLTLLRPDRSMRVHFAIGWVLVAASAAALVPRALPMLATDLSHTALNREISRSISIALDVQFYAYVVWIGRFVFARHPDHAVPEKTRLWLKTLLAASATAGTLVFAKSMFRLADDVQAHAYLDLIVGSSAAAILCALTLFALVQREVLIGQDATRRTRRKADPAPFRQADLAMLLSFMTAREPFLDPGLTLRKLARQITMPERDLSRLINEAEGLHFFDFVNRHRIGKAAAILSDPDQVRRTILEIAHEVGFQLQIIVQLGLPQAYRPDTVELSARACHRAVSTRSAMTGSDFP